MLLALLGERATGPVLRQAPRNSGLTPTLFRMGRFKDTMVNGPLGVPPHEARRLQEMLEPGEELRYAFVALTKLNWRTLTLYMLSRGSVNTIGKVLVLITNRSLYLWMWWSSTSERRAIGCSTPISHFHRPSGQSLAMPGSYSTVNPFASQAEQG